MDIYKVPTIQDSVNTKSFLAAFTNSDFQRFTEGSTITTVRSRTKYDTKRQTLLDLGPAAA
jgi:hypothetical protein